MRNDCNNALCEGTEANGCKKCGVAPRHPELGDEVKRTFGLMHVHHDDDPEDQLAELAQRSFEAGLKYAAENRKRWFVT